MQLVLCTIVLIAWFLDASSWVFVPGSKRQPRTLRTSRREQILQGKIDLATERTLVAKFQEQPRKLQSEVIASITAPSANRAANVQSMFGAICAFGDSSAAAVSARQLKHGFAELLSIHLSSDQAHWIVKDHDRDEDGMLNSREFASAYEWLKLNSIEFASACLLREEQQTRVMGRTTLRKRVNPLAADAADVAPGFLRLGAIMALIALWAFGLAVGLVVRNFLEFPSNLS